MPLASMLGEPSGVDLCCCEQTAPIAERPSKHRRALQSETREVRPNDPVTLARGLFESLSLPYLDTSIADRDQPVSLERPQDNRDSRTLHAEHYGKKFLFE